MMEFWKPNERLKDNAEGCCDTKKFQFMNLAQEEINFFISYSQYKKQTR